MLDIVDFLAGLNDFRGVPRPQLEWLVRESEVVTRESGLYLKPGDIANEMIIVLEGSLRVYVFQNGQQKFLFTTGPGAMSGLLPYSRMKESPVYAEIIEPVTLLSLDKSHFREMICANPELTEVFVHALIDRAKQFTGLHFQNEKLMALGKLSAGLSHELNNPAAAILRSAEDLKQTIGSLPKNFARLGAMRLSTEEIEVLQPIIEKLSHPMTQSLTLVGRMEKEDVLTDWAESLEISTDCVAALIDTPVSIADMEALASAISDERLPVLIEWIANSLQAAQTAEEIATASRRVSELVRSIKNYTRMDQVQDMQQVEINDGIQNTLTILQHKIRKNNVTVREELAGGLPPILGFPGELNQVWTNILDNALDAMANGGELQVRTIARPEHVVFSVIDSGSGISPENLERIFDPFFTTKDIGEGTGVGLDVVQKVVQLHKGTIDVTSQPGRTEFIVAFPRM